jgi:hypothetical protein
MTGYHEKLFPALWLVLALGLFTPASLLIFFPLSPLLGAVVGVALWWGSIAMLWIFSPRIRIDTTNFHAGKAHIDHRFISAMEAFLGEDARDQRGVKLDARAWLVLRPWIGPVVKVTISDSQDPTPYWLVSSRHPDKLISAWRQATT